MRFDFVVRELGRMRYRDAWDVQLETHDAVAAGRLPPTLLLVEHPHVVTFGKKGGREHLLVPEEELLARGVELFDVERGGDVTYHGPGQLVGYPIFPVGRRVRDYLRALEAATVRTLAAFGVPAYGTPGYAGVWSGDEKLVAIGVAVKRDVSFHGFAMNVHTDLAAFDAIVPCGIRDRGVTSLSAVLGRHVTLHEAMSPLVQAFRETFDPEFAFLDAFAPPSAAMSVPPVAHAAANGGPVDVEGAAA